MAMGFLGWRGKSTPKLSVQLTTGAISATCRSSLEILANVFLVRSETGSFKKKNQPQQQRRFAYESSWLTDLAVTVTASLGGKGTLSGSKNH